MSIPRDVGVEPMSERTKEVLGLNLVPSEQIEPMEWVEVVKEALNVVRPYLAYHDGFEKISKHLNFHPAHSEKFLRKTPPDRLYFMRGSGLSEESSCVMVALFRDPLSREAGNERIEKHLFLIQEGKFGYWEARYEVQLPDLYVSVFPTTEVAKSSHFILLENKETFSIVFEKFPKAGKAALEMLSCIMKEVVEKKIAELENELARVRAKKQKFQDIIRRVV
ncbi:hypothetical protein HY250_04040 [Candidatus Azambacteria bacterium]|nr:hypothetical protein [Candidatus Azambacteria bacterium]MBI3685547.1 hypothetical protein [Candidatus Azambacteria bacterium]